MGWYSNRMIDADAIARIQKRIDQLDVHEATVSKQAGGGPDLIRNWRRTVKQKGTVDAQHSHVEKVAEALGVTTDWMLHGTGPGFSETPAPLTPPPSKADPEIAPENIILDLRSGMLEIRAKVDRSGLEWLLSTLPNYLTRLT